MIHMSSSSKVPSPLVCTNMLIGAIFDNITRSHNNKLLKEQEEFLKQKCKIMHDENSAKQIELDTARSLKKQNERTEQTFSPDKQILPSTVIPNSTVHIEVDPSNVAVLKPHVSVQTTYTPVFVPQHIESTAPTYTPIANVVPPQHFNQPSRISPFINGGGSLWNAGALW